MSPKMRWKEISKNYCRVSFFCTFQYRISLGEATKYPLHSFINVCFNTSCWYNTSSKVRTSSVIDFATITPKAAYVSMCWEVCCVRHHKCVRCGARQKDKSRKLRIKVINVSNSHTAHRQSNMRIVMQIFLLGVKWHGFNGNMTTRICNSVPVLLFIRHATHTPNLLWKYLDMCAYITTKTAIKEACRRCKDDMERSEVLEYMYSHMYI